MKRILPWMVIATTSVKCLVAGTSPIYENFGFNDYRSNPPEIDAFAFANYGTFIVGTTLPFDFQNTLYLTNKGAMIGASGFQFDSASTVRPRQPAASFVNARGASVTAQGDGFSIIFFPGLGVIFNPIPSFLLVNATNVTHEGLLSAGSGGLLSLKGENVNLAHGGLEIRPIEGTGTGDDNTNFFPDIAIYDLYWGGLTNDLLNSSNLVRPLTPFTASVQTPPHFVTNAGGFFSVQQISLPFAEAFVYTDADPSNVNDTNWIVQAVLVGVSDPAFSIDVRFANSPILTNVFKTAVVQLAFTETNEVTGGTRVQTLYMLDRLASWTNYSMLSNLTVFPTTFRPANYEVSRLVLPEFILGVPGNATLDPNYIYQPTYSNVIVTNFFSAYGASVQSSPFQLQPVQGLSITNQPGRLVIQAKELDLSGTRMRGNTFALIQTDHLVGSSNAVVDAPNVTFNLASTNGTLRIQDLAREESTRLGGTIRAWSGLWTNNIGLLATNLVEDPPGSGDFTNMVVTNVVDVGIHVFVLDATALSTVEPVLVRDFVSRSTNVIFRDAMQVVDSFLMDATTFTLEGRITLSSNARDWASNSAPQLLYFTNQGTLTIENFGHIGSDRAQPYEVIDNRGQLTAESLALRSRYLDNSGTLGSAQQLEVSADAGKVEGTLDANGDIRIGGGSFKFRNSTVSTRSGLYFNVSDSLSDSGGDAANSWTCQDGFHASRKPPFGDFLGTVIRSTAPRFLDVPHTWPAEDRGDSAAGYTNNLAIGHLNLDVDVLAALSFHGVGPSNALYVDFLELDPAVATNLESVVVIDSNFVVYFADANVPVEELDGRLGGRLRWVRDFAGPNSSVDVLLVNGQVIKVNRALRESLTIDSDGDGVANGQDAYPFDAAVWTTVSLATVAGTKAPLISWNAVPSATYVLEYTTDLAQPDWKPLKTLANDTPAPEILSLVDTNALSGPTQRFYRIRYQAR